MDNSAAQKLIEIAVYIESIQGDQGDKSKKVRIAAIYEDPSGKFSSLIYFDAPIHMANQFFVGQKLDVLITRSQ